MDLNPRAYQQAIFNTAKDKNTLVVLPTGVGKTLIAIMLSLHRLKEFPAKKALILAPTKPLVEQHYESFQKSLPDLFAELSIFTGEVHASERKELWDGADIIFSTPQCIANDLKKQLYSLSDVCLLVIDEAHRCLKNYDYTTVVEIYKRQSENQRILGLTASPGSEADTVRQICKHLDTEAVEVRTRDSEDVKPYLQEREYDKHEVPFPNDFQEIRILLKRIYDSKVDQLRSRSLLFGPANKITLLKLQKNLAQRSGDFNAMIGMSLTAQAIKIQHALELLETQTLYGLREYLLSLMKQAEEKKSKGVQTLVKSPEFNAAFISLTQLTAEKREHPKVHEAIAIVEDEVNLNPNAKVIIFTQFRDTASVLSEEMRKNPLLKPEIFVGQAKKGDTGLSQKKQKEVIERFKSGESNVLCATSIGEEGLDIPEVNAVIFYEPVPSAIRKIQRAGRTARLAPGKLIILITKGTRDETYHYTSTAKEKKMYRTIDLVKKQINNKSSLNRYL